MIAPDQVGFCSSTKPAHYQYSFQQLAQNTHGLLQNLKISRAIVIGHSTGGMLATRCSLMYPQAVEQLVMVNPIGLEDWKAKGVPWRSVDQWFERELNTSADGIRNYEQRTCYGGRWKPEYDRWVDMLAGLNNRPGHRLVAWNSALIYDMIFTQPVYYEFRICKPHHADDRHRRHHRHRQRYRPSAVKARIGHYAELGKQAAKLIPHATLIEFAGLGHAPQMEEPGVSIRHCSGAAALSGRLA